MCISPVHPVIKFFVYNIVIFVMSIYLKTLHNINHKSRNILINLDCRNNSHSSIDIVISNMKHIPFYVSKLNKFQIFLAHIGTDRHTRHTPPYTPLSSILFVDCVQTNPLSARWAYSNIIYLCLSVHFPCIHVCIEPEMRISVSNRTQ